MFKYFLPAVAALLFSARAGHAQDHAYWLNNGDNEGATITYTYPSLNIPGFPVVDMYSTDATCRTSNMKFTGKPKVLQAGTAFNVGYNANNISPITTRPIQGPCTFYMANATSKGNGASWFKIAEIVGKDDKWCSEVIQETMYSSSLIIPAGLNPGNYILRTEVIDLPKGDMTADDFTRGPHFYVNCMAVQVTSDGTDTPKGNKIPGIYNNMEEKFWVDGSVSANVATFKIPGPQVYTPSTPRGTT